ncbi:major facilitator superfamily domain-containing protein [Gigaspora rosea]|uniref:Major facilitator superfamily domain-containing protein n=1 Tax=Gigaspora rosea TaxID=44941 RepID=A0A397UYA1_9GLOM|nr:major facilitator superfamily domain-containing protein [Gigaspora rosea]
MSNREYSSREYSNVIHTDVLVQLDTSRRQALANLDDTKIKWFHFRTCIISGVGFFTSAYDLFVINLVSNILGYAYFSSDSVVPINLDTGIKTSAAIGNIIGQVLFGWMADRYGRKKVYGIELSIMIAATAGTALSANSFSMSMFAGIIFWRIILGIGVGGDYPLSAVITSEFAMKNRRGAMMALVFAMQGFGILTAGLVTMITLKAFESSIKQEIHYLDYVWRIIVGIGMIPATVVLYFRLTIPESPRYTMDVYGNIEKGAKNIEILLSSDNHVKNDKFEAFYLVGTPKASWKDFRDYFGKWKNGKILLGTCVSWFAIDVAFYGLSFNQGIIMQNATPNYLSFNDPYDTLFNIALGNIIVTLVGTIPGYWCSVLLIDKLGRRFIQLMGFAVLTVLYLIIGFSYAIVTTSYQWIFVILFIISMRPNVSIESIDKSVKSSTLGIKMI